MPPVTACLYAAAAVAAMMIVFWIVSVVRRDVSIVDSLWGPGFLVLILVAGYCGEGSSARTSLLTAVVALWSVRLSAYITRRNWGEGEDYRYREIRARHGEGFWFKSLYIVFGLQGLLMLIIGAPLLAVATLPSAPPFVAGDYLGVALFGVGFFFEAVGDRQLARFKADPANKGRVMDQGLWRYTRHPNYFGETLIWWGFFLLALPVSIGKYLVFSPMLMTFLLLRVSGVSLLEKGMVERRPQYADYIRRTSAFIPMPPKK
ncbi:MAG: DUF1295 domain-containing protein [Deltaproteobacteria bacterium]|nr:DUF1295 domain-containing protein [Deltaproteobacteria bacterium]